MCFERVECYVIRDYLTANIAGLRFITLLSGIPQDMTKNEGPVSCILLNAQKPVE